MGPCTSKKQLQKEPNKVDQPQPDQKGKKSFVMNDMFLVAEEPPQPNPDAALQPLQQVGDKPKDEKKKEDEDESILSIFQQSTEGKKQRFQPKSIVVQVLNPSKALRVNSEAIKYPTEQPDIKLFSPKVGAIF